MDQPGKRGNIMADKDVYVEKIKAKIDEWNAELDKLVAKAKQAKAGAKEKSDEQIGRLRAKIEALQSKLAELQRSGGSAWVELKSGVEQASASLKEAFKKAKAHFD